VTIRWRGLMAPDDARTGDRRAFAPGAITHRKLPLPAEWVREKGRGHEGAVTVASIDAVYATEEGLWGTGEVLDPMFIPDVTPFTYLAAKKLLGPSVDLDPDMTYTVVPDPQDTSQGLKLVTRGNIHGVTFVSTPAFSQVSIEIFDDEEAAALLASAGAEYFAINSRSWRSWPIAEKNTEWSADASIARIAAWSGGDGKKYAQAFLYYDAKSRADVRETYRLPIADVVNGKLVLIPRAVYQAAAFLSGAHGGVKDIPENEVQPLQRVVTEIYAVLAQEQQDERLVPPWQRGGRQGAQDSGALSIMKEVVVDDVMEETEFTVRTSGWSDLPTSTGAWDEGAARAALDAWAGDDMAKYAKGFLWSDGSGNKTGFKFPIARPVDGKLTIFIRAVNNAKARLSSADIPSADKAKILSILNGLQERYDGEDDEEMSLVAAAMDRPPAAWFADPKLDRPTPLEVTEDGRVFGHMALWNSCHKAFRHKCIMPPRSATGYKHFRLGKVLCDDGSMVKVGRVTVGTGHADERFGVIPAREHYDNTGTCAAIVVPYEDKFGLALAGATVAGLPEEKVAELRRSPLSGDWRRANGNLELVGALGVNDPGFEVVSEDEMGVYSLTAAGMLTVDGSTEGCGCAEEVEEPRDFTDRVELLASVDELLATVDNAARVTAWNEILRGM
jgi:hypothetical protein